jgi:TnpA family transposase
MRGKELLTPEQRKELLWLSLETKYELATHYTLSDVDLEIIHRHRRDYNRLGFAIQLCVWRYPSCSLVDVREIKRIVVVDPNADWLLQK